MRDKPALDDNAAHDRLVAARETLGNEPGATVRADTALRAARRALNVLQVGLIAAAEANRDEIEAVIPDEPASKF